MFAIKKTLVLLSCLFALTVGCASTTAPRGWLSTPQQAQAQAYGGWIRVSYQNASGKFESKGELIAVHADSVFVLTAAGLTGLSKAEISRAVLTAYDAQAGGLAGWSIAGTLSTLSHGYGLILSAPVWILAGTIATSAQSYAPQIKFPKKPWEEFRKYARFPAGLPEELDRSRLSPKR